MRAPSILAAGVLASLTGGCTVILGIEHDYEVGERTGTGGEGGGTSSSSTTSSSSSSSTSTTTSSSSSSSTTTSSSSSSSTSTTSSSSNSSASSSGAVSCPGATMVKVGAFCVDATEVTNAAYAAWLLTGPSTAGQPSFCAWNTEFTPSSGWPAAATLANHPVVWVDWCDARAYCTAAGKRLCGGVGGGAGPYGAGFADPAQSEWMAACSNGSATAYPYGAGYAGNACDGKDYQHPSQSIAVGSAAVCHGVGAPYASIFDMSGNAAEWEDACSGASGSADTCRVRGGSYGDSSGALRCDADVTSETRSTTSATTGFRCCGG